jgi:hypothetical protein
MRQDMPDKDDPASVADFHNQPISIFSDIEHGPLSDSIRMRINPPYILKVGPQRRFRHTVPDVERGLGIWVPHGKVHQALSANHVQAFTP